MARTATLTLAAAPGRRGRKAITRREDIVTAALSVFLRKGFAATTTRDIAAAAGIAEGTIYNYFDSKRDILAFFLEAFRNPLRFAAIERSAADLDYREFVGAVFAEPIPHDPRDMDAYMKLLPDVFGSEDLLAVYHDAILRPITGMLERKLRAEARKGHLADDRIEMAVSFAVATIAGLVLLAVMKNPTVVQMMPNRKRTAPEIGRYVLGGLEAILEPGGKPAARRPRPRANRKS